MGRRPRAWGPPIHGILVVDKPLGMGSTKVVTRVRHAAQGNRTGHAGTLDPLATGVLVVCIGRATKAVEHVMGLGKTYVAEVDLGAFTTTDDAEGDRTEVMVEQAPTVGAIRAVLDDLTGEVEQVPPAYSALKIDGKPAYERIRAGEDVQMRARIIHIDEITIDAYTWPRLTVTVRCGRGTYIRSLARQIGEALGTGGTLASLRRTAVGSYDLSKAVYLADVPAVLAEADLLPVPEADQ